MKTVDPKNAITKRVKEVEAGGIIEYYDFEHLTIRTCMVTQKEYDGLYRIVDIVTGDIIKINGDNCITHYVNATLLLGGEE